MQFNLVYNRLQRLASANIITKTPTKFYAITEIGKEQLLNALELKARIGLKALSQNVNQETNRANRYELGIQVLNTYKDEAPKLLAQLGIHFKPLGLKNHSSVAFEFEGYEYAWSGTKLRVKGKEKESQLEITVYKLDRDVVQDLCLRLLRFEELLKEKIDPRIKLARYNDGQLRYKVIRREIAHTNDVFAKRTVAQKEKFVVRDPLDNKPDVLVDDSFSEELEGVHPIHAPKTMEHYRQFRNNFKSPEEYGKFIQSFRTGEWDYKEEKNARQEITQIVREIADSGKAREKELDMIRDLLLGLTIRLNKLEKQDDEKHFGK